MKIITEPIYCSSTSDFTEKLAHVFLGELERFLSIQESVNIAISGGSTPSFLFKQIVRHSQTMIDWSKITFYWVDERSVAPDHEDSNFGKAKKELLDHIPEAKYYRIHGEMSPDLAASEYRDLLLNTLPLCDSIPQFDIMLLGMGEDGHTASLFPGSEVLDENKRSVVHVWVPEKKMHRISLTFPVINNSKTKILAFKGKKKTELFKKINEREKVFYPIEMVDFATNKNFIIIGD